MNKIKACIPHRRTSYHTKIWLQVNVWMSVTVNQNMSETMRSFKCLWEWRNVLGLKNKNMEIVSILKPSYRRRKRIASQNHGRKRYRQDVGEAFGFKALENKLQLLWARKRIINIVDLGQDFYLATFTSEDDQKFALLEGLWMTYDHYLTVRA